MVEMKDDHLPNQHYTRGEVTGVKLIEATEGTDRGGHPLTTVAGAVLPDAVKTSDLTAVSDVVKIPAMSTDAAKTPDQTGPNAEMMNRGRRGAPFRGVKSGSAKTNRAAANP